MTVGTRGVQTGRLVQVEREGASNSDSEDQVQSLTERSGVIGADLRVGANLSAAVALQANEALCSVGMKTIGSAFQIDAETASALGLGSVPGLELHVRPYINGRDFVSSPRGKWVVDFFGLEAASVRERFPAAYQHLLDHAKPERDLNRNALFRNQWWVIGHPRQQFRLAVAGLPRYIVTVETAKHRVFAFMDSAVVPDSTLVTFAFSDSYMLGVLSSGVHVVWSLAAGGRLGVGNDPRYNKSRCFEPFPLPSDEAGLTRELTTRIRTLAEQLDAHRKTQQAVHPDLTLTGMYNVLEKLRTGEPLTAKEKVIHTQGLVSVLKSLHDELDAAVLQAYGWSDLQPALAAHTQPETRAAAVETLLERLVALNAKRAAEEAAGTVRWLRPEFQQRGRTATQTALDVDEPADETEVAEAGAAAPAAAVPKRPWPTGLAEQIKAVAEVMSGTPRALSLADVEARFSARGRWRDRLPVILDTLEALGRVRPVAEGRWQAAL